MFMNPGKVAFVLFSAMVTTTVVAQVNEGLPARFTAFAVSINGHRTHAVASPVEIRIDRWSSAGEAERLMKVLTDKGPEALLDTLRGLTAVGSIQTPGNLAYDLHFAHQVPGEDGGRRIVLATDRPISFWEAVNRPRTFDYPFTLIELRMNGKGEGEGKLALATKISVTNDGRTLELENYAAQPIALNEVRRQSR